MKKRNFRNTISLAMVLVLCLVSLFPSGASTTDNRTPTLSLSQYSPCILQGTGHVNNVSPATSVDVFKSQFNPGVKAALTLTDSDGRIKTSGYVATGDIIMGSADTEEIWDMYIVVVRGDVTGDGKISSTDYTRIKRAFDNRYQFTTEEFLAADINDDGKISTVDYIRVKKAFKTGTAILFPALPDLNAKEVIIKNVYDETEAKEIQIAIWSPPNPEQYATSSALDKICKTMAEAGITHVYNESEWGTVTLNRLMDCYQKYGIKAIIGIPNQYKDMSLRLIQSTMNHPACWGFNLRDEPIFEQFEYFGELSAAIKKILPADKQLTTNFLPNNVFFKEDSDEIDFDEYERYITEYAAATKTDTLSFDHYPLYPGVTLEDEEMVLYLQNLLEFNTQCRELGISSSSMVQSAAWSNHRIPTATELEFLVSLNLVSGMDGITYFLYWTNIGGNGEILYDGLMSYNGSPNPLFYTAKNINLGLGKMKGVFLDYDQIGYIFTNAPASYKNFDMSVVEESVLMDSFGPVKSVTSKGSVLSGCFTDDSGKEALYVMNFNMTDGQNESVKLSFSENTSYKVWTYDGLIDMDNGNALTLELAPGEAAFVEFN